MGKEKNITVIIDAKTSFKKIQPPFLVYENELFER